MRKWITWLSMAAVAGLSTNANAAQILVLGDDQSETTISPYLESLGHTVVSDSTYYDWDGVIPNSTDVILYLNGYEYGNDTGENTDSGFANQSILDFVANGGGLIFTEWYAYDEKTEAIASLLPVAYNGEYYYQANWNVSEGYGDHELIENLISSSFTEGNGDDDSYSDVVALDGTTVVMEDDGGIPMLSYNTKHGGTVVHINDGLSYDDFISDNILSVINSSVMFASKNSVVVTEPTSIALFGVSFAMFAFSRRRTVHSRTN